MENQFDKIERYLLGELTASELEIFETAFKSDDALASAVSQHREMFERLNALRLRNKVKAAISSKNRKTKFLPGNQNIWAIAASLGLLIIAVWFLIQPVKKSSDVTNKQSPTNQILKPNGNDSTNNVSANPIDTSKLQHGIHIDAGTNKSLRFITLASAFLIYPSQILTRDAVDQHNPSDNTPFNLAKEAFNNKDYRLTLKHLQSMKIDKQDEDALVLRAHANFQIRKFDSASSDFESLQNSFQYKHEARWNFVLCQIALGKKELANKLLSEMETENDFPYQAKAKELKEKFNF